MPLDKTSARQKLAKADFRNLFVDDLGWDHLDSELNVQVEGRVYLLRAIAHKRGMVAYLSTSQTPADIPNHATRRKIERQVAKSAHEHLIIFTDAENRAQTWQWVKREPGKPAACREHPYHHGQSGDPLLQKLDAIAFTIEEEEQLTLPDVTRRARAGFDVEKITKKFYDRFKAEHAQFLKFISGIAEAADREWYASVMMNRMMFVYFIQKKGFLNGERDYLRNRLNMMRRLHGKDKFYSFYRFFLLRLFHEGLGSSTRTPQLEELLGKIPYLNGGLFDVHELERPERGGKDIAIPDPAFERIFDFFGEWQWHLDERALRNDKEINPDVLGYIFEKYVNQKQMGAYYTKEDITEYISKNTVIPFLFDAARAKCKVAFENPSGPTVWDHLTADPDRYIYKAVRHGVTWHYNSGHPDKGEPLAAARLLPPEIAQGLNPPTLNDPIGDVGSVNDIETIRLRKNWNTPAPPEFALPTETWREVIARRTRYEDIRAKLLAGQVREINDLITLNLDIRQFAQDVIENSEGPEILRAFWQSIEKISVLDPTCGSGAFLFAALNILEPLYESCLDRMEAFVADLERSGEKHRPEKFSDFRKVLENVAAHPNRKYFIFKSIILNNLYGVDIMEEAVEICKLRLFLKLAAQVEPDLTAKNFGIEPLPDVDFNIRAGNSLVGYATYDQVLKSAEGDWEKEVAIESVKTSSADLQDSFKRFRSVQIEGASSVPASHKQELRGRLAKLTEELNLYLAGDFRVRFTKKEVFEKWLSSHYPFHWFVEFFGPIHVRGGLDVIIGNPPYVEYREIKKRYSLHQYATLECGNLYAFTIERSLDVLRDEGRLGMIVQLPIVCTDRMTPLQAECMARSSDLWFANFDDRPARLFDGLQHIRATVFSLVKSAAKRKATVYSTNYNRWYSESRSDLFQRLSYSEVTQHLIPGAIPKIGDDRGGAVRRRLDGMPAVGVGLNSTGPRLYYHNAPQYWIRAMTFIPYFWNERDGEQHTTQLKSISGENKVDAAILSAVLNSSLFYWWFIVLSDCRHLNVREIQSFPFSLAGLPSEIRDQLVKLSGQLMTDLLRHKKRKTAEYKTTGTVKYDEFYPRHSKPIIDEIDCMIARHYGFSEEELDFIVNYDIKYRMGRGADGEEDC